MLTSFNCSHYICACLCVGISLCAPHVCSTCGGEKGALGSLKLELQIDVDDRNGRSLVIGNAKHLSAESPLLALILIFT